MSGYDQLSRAAYRAVDLEANERLVMAHIEQHFRGEFTRAELAKSMGWAINRITGRVVSLRDKGLLTEDKLRTVKCKATHGDAHPLKNTTPPSPSNESADVFNRLVAVVPCIGYMEQMSIETAKRILKDPKNAFFKQAEAVLKGRPCNT